MAVLLAQDVQTAENERDTNGGSRDAEVPGTVRREELGGRAEVVGDGCVAVSFRCSASTRSVEHNVHGPAEEEVGHELPDGEGVVTDDAVCTLVLLHPGPGRWHVRLAVEHVVGLGVVLGVGVLPGEVRHKEEGVEDPADRVVDVVVRREPAVAALVCEHPPEMGEFF